MHIDLVYIFDPRIAGTDVIVPFRVPTTIARIICSGAVARAFGACLDYADTPEGY